MINKLIVFGKIENNDYFLITPRIERERDKGIFIHIFNRLVVVVVVSLAFCHITSINYPYPRIINEFKHKKK